MPAISVDRFDLQLLAELQRDGHATNSALGEKIHLSTSQVSRRIQRLQEAHVIDHFAAILDPAAVGLDVVAFTQITLDRQGTTSADKFEREIEKLPQVLGVLRWPARRITCCASSAPTWRRFRRS